MTRLEKLAADRVALRDRAKALREKETLTEAEGLEIEDIISKLDANQAAQDRERKLDASLAGEPADRIEVHDVADEAPYSMGEFLIDVAFEARAHEKRPRLVRHQQRTRQVMAAASGMNEGLPAEGGFAVGTDFGGQIATKAYENSLAGRCARTGISGASNSMKMNGINETSRVNGSRYGGVQGYWVEEAGSISASKPKFRQIEFLLKKNAVLYYATDELLADASAIEANARECVAGEMAFMLQDAIVNGNGAGKPLGILASPCLVTVDAETGQDADTVVFENISKMYSALWAPSRANAVWLINQEIEPQLDKLALPVGTGGMPAYMPPGGLADSPYGRIKGRPVIAIEQCAALGDAGDIVLADLSQYMLVDKGGAQMAASMHVLFTTDEMCFRFIYRVDGQPLWNSALTPFKGAQTLSPFVTLSARA